VPRLPQSALSLRVWRTPPVRAGHHRPAGGGSLGVGPSSLNRPTTASNELLFVCVWWQSCVGEQARWDEGATLSRWCQCLPPHTYTHSATTHLNSPSSSDSTHISYSPCARGGRGPVTGQSRKSQGAGRGQSHACARGGRGQSRESQGPARGQSGPVSQGSVRGWSQAQAPWASQRPSVLPHP
jgi:hypothetical protein